MNCKNEDCKHNYRGYCYNDITLDDEGHCEQEELIKKIREKNHENQN